MHKCRIEGTVDPYPTGHQGVRCHPSEISHVVVVHTQDEIEPVEPGRIELLRDMAVVVTRPLQGSLRAAVGWLTNMPTRRSGGFDGGGGRGPR